MTPGRRALVCLAVATILGLLLYYRSVSSSLTIKSLRSGVPQVIGLGDLFSEDGYEQDPFLSSAGHHRPSAATTTSTEPDTPKPTGPIAFGDKAVSSQTFTRNLVMARTKEENVTWLDEVDLGPEIKRMIYVADDPTAPLHPPTNKAHEVMIYLTYIVDFYDELPDISIFMHSHRFAWHNDDLLNWDASEMIKRLSGERVQRQGYMNMRCHWIPGCPEWIHPGRIEPDREKLEQSLMADAWAELFPLKPIPDVLAQPCCSQFALSRNKIHELPRATYSHFRDWIMRSDIRDSMSGRVFEYLWQVIFTDESVFCPNQRSCYCDGFGVCFETEETFDKWFEIRYYKMKAEQELQEWEDQFEAIEKYRKDGRLQGIEGSDLVIPEFGKKEELQASISEMEADMEDRRIKALQRGVDPKMRAESDGRDWKEGDGY
ncbi:hypothetical protein LTR10_017944 [Elasticomyces elasticus]|uniref:Uncharacterized protein n=1 Tax=Exophiala sideris TaxID=1016849 RepID=A0ABR0IWI9_9EURO|nr:hypothetical protein LTR10_017944 [Elasticomyces elasticus]KAK5021764.1 hypothetical protein LTS07_010659 [Exophiala sideris]KAK5025876.1 hypothetical protein LTR13_010340 [Exophiala sideris]KAK5050240.1 hypothetical protein LTR69_010728 [Exophiala sideris]KAK5177001.1 hypothetical protein LTR44_010438 [Eurotiomycetes sp. CCFEE 6388]